MSPSTDPSAPLHHVHLVSDATGETVSSIARACLVQFEGVRVREHLWWLVRTPGQVQRVLDGLRAAPGVMLCTMIDPALRTQLEEGCRAAGVAFLPVLDPVLRALAGQFGRAATGAVGRQHALDETYFSRIDAMDFALYHDDGQNLGSVGQADVILVGVSRTSKTPTCLYLANRGLKAANFPLVPGMTPPPEILNAKGPLMVGLTREPSSLADIRRARLRIMKQDEESNYADPDQVRAEVTSARRLFTGQGWPVIDVTRRSIEEVSAAIFQLLEEHRGENGA